MAIPFTPTTGSASIGATEFSLPANSTTPVAQTTAAELETLLDLSAMVAGDQYRVRVVEVVNGGTAQVLWEAWPTGAQTGLLRIPPIRVNEGWDVRVKLMAGSARTVAWSLKKDVGDVNALTVGAGAIGATQIASAAITAAKFATDAIDANALAAGAVAEIQAGLATSAAVAGVQADTDDLQVRAADIQGRLPAALDGGGNIKAGVQTISANAITASSTAADFVAEVAAAVMASVVETGLDVTGSLRLLLSAGVAKVSGFLTNAPVFRNVTDTKNRITATTTTDGRTAVTVDPT